MIGESRPVPYARAMLQRRCHLQLPLLIALPALGLLPALPVSAGEMPPNILLILADDLGNGDLGTCGAADLQTPNLDQLFARGMRWDRFYANCPVCSPTRAALLTGRYPDRVGVPGVIRTHPEDSWGWLSPEARLLPSLLKPAGYHTALVGKWHLGLQSPNTPNDRGFDHFHGFLGDMMDDYQTHRRFGDNLMRRDTCAIDPAGHATDLFTAWAVEYLNTRRAQASPFLLYLAYNAPHTPIQPPADWLERVHRREPELPANRAKLVALIEHLDAGIGEVLEALERNGLQERTLVIFTSDNGGQLSVGARNGPLRGGKQDMYEGGIRVPMVAVWPGHIAPGSRTESVALTMDLLPTCLEAAGEAVPEGLDGLSLLPVLTGAQPALPEREFVWMRREGNLRYQGRDYYALRRGQWKLVQNSPFEPYQLFNLADDPEERTDVSAARKNIHQDLIRRLMRHVQRAGEVPWQPPAP